jgi:hypothetical protein|eukprot:COSAG01_NODE_5283_length_4357_cov_369.903711_4_plen_74_part_00
MRDSSPYTMGLHARRHKVAASHNPPSPMVCVQRGGGRERERGQERGAHHTHEAVAAAAAMVLLLLVPLVSGEA